MFFAASKSRLNFVLEHADGINFENFEGRAAQGTLMAAEKQYAINAFDAAFGAPTDFNRIYVGGMAVAKYFENMTVDMADNARTDYLKCAVAGIALGGKNPLQLASAPNADGNVDITDIHTVTNRPAPKSSFFRRIFEMIGILKPHPTPDAVHEAHMADKFAQARPITIQAEAMRFAEIDIAASLDMAQKLHEDKRRLVVEMFGEAKHQPSVYDNIVPAGEMSSNNIRLERSGATLGIAFLVTRGHAFADILDPEKLKEEKQLVGHTLKVWMLSERLEKSRHSIKIYEDENTPESMQKAKNIKAEQVEIQALLTQYEMHRSTIDAQDAALAARTPAEKLATMLSRYADVLAEMPHLQIDYNDPAQLRENYRDMFCRGYATFDMGQEINQGEIPGILKRTMSGEEFDKKVDMLAYNSMPYSCLETALLTSKATQHDPEDSNYRGVLSGILACRALRDEACALLNTTTTLANCNGRDFMMRYSGAATALSLQLAEGGPPALAKACAYIGQDLPPPTIESTDEGLKVNIDLEKAIDVSEKLSPMASPPKRAVALDPNTFESNVPAVAHSAPKKEEAAKEKTAPGVAKK